MDETGRPEAGEIEDVAPERPRRVELLIVATAIALGTAAFAAIPDFRHAVSLALHGHLSGLRAQIRGLGAGGAALLLALMLAHAVLFYPTEIATATAGFVYGFLPGLGLAIVGWLTSGLLAYLLGRTVGRPLALALFGHRRFCRLQRAIERGGTPLLLAGRLVPVVPFSLLCYAAGAAGVGVWQFSWTTVVGYLPLTAATAYLGSQAKSLSLEDPVVWIIGALLVVLLAASRFVDLGATDRSKR
jgi:uncharacterized membrane protein YdjX (TVP38/TMEM64 family)